MKRVIFITVFAVCGLMVSAQTFVETTPSNKNVIIEQFSYPNAECPDADVIINQLQRDNPNRVFGINIRNYGFSKDIINDFTCKEGMAFLDYFKPWNYTNSCDYYYPGMVNRGTPECIKQWQSSTNTLLTQPSCLNVAAQGSIDWDSRLLTLTVEVYYTGNSNMPENYLTVALLQNNMEDEESRGFYNSAQELPNGKYNHLRILRAIISEQWGDVIATTTKGSFFTKTYIYTIPDTIEPTPRINTILPQVQLGDLEIIVFVSESHTNIISGAKAEITHENMPEINLLLQLENTNEIMVRCTDSYLPLYFMVKNEGSDTIHSLEYNLLKDNQPILQNQVWNSRLIKPFAMDTINLGNINLDAGIESLISIEITQVNEKDMLITVAKPFTRHLVEDARGAMKLIIAHDQFGRSNGFILYNLYDVFDESELHIYYTWSDLSSPGIKEYTYDFLPQKVSCYALYFFENLNRGYGEGYFKLLASDGTVLLYNDGKNCRDYTFINVTEPVGIVETHCNASLRVYPNPANGQLTIEYGSSATLTAQERPLSEVEVEIYSVVGQNVGTWRAASLQEEITIDISSLASGMYFLKIGNKTARFVKE